jgi:peptide methionine sulfoxide reductase msrA/msrB
MDHVNDSHRVVLKDDSLSYDVLDIIRNQATEKPSSQVDIATSNVGSYLCRGCGLALFRSSAQFNAGCGWPSFDEAISGAVLEQIDSDGIRTEISCVDCSAHLGHVFDGEKYTAKNRRYCVNQKSLDYVESDDVLHTEEAILAAGCFWGVQYYLNTLACVLKTEVGYTGGQQIEPTYADVCSGSTGHYEAIRVVYDSRKLNYESLVKYFFEIHDPGQANGQGADIGLQYQSAIFYYNDFQQHVAVQVIKLLENQGLVVSTKLLPVRTFWRAELSHQQYYEKNSSVPYCHQYTKRFS